MIKIVSVSCVLVAVCVSFQQIEAAAFHNPLGPLFDNAQDQFAGVLNKVTQRGDEVLRHLGEGATKISSTIDTTLANEVQRLKEKSQLFLQTAQDANTSCTKLYNEGRAALAELVSIFDSCLLNQTRQTTNDIHHLVDVISTLQSTLPQEAQEIIQCFKSSGLRNMSSCVTKALQDFSKLGITAVQAVRAVIELVTFYPSVKLCYQFAYLDFARRNLFGLLNDVGLCVQSLIKNIV